MNATEIQENIEHYTISKPLPPDPFGNIEVSIYLIRNTLPDEMEPEFRLRGVCYHRLNGQIEHSAVESPAFALQDTHKIQIALDDFANYLRGTIAKRIESTLITNKHQ